MISIPALNTQMMGLPIGQYSRFMPIPGVPMDLYGLGVPPSQMQQMDPKVIPSTSPYTEIAPAYNTFAKGLRNVLQMR